ALATGAMDWDSYRLLEDRAVRGLLPKIHCELDPEIEALFPAHMAAKVTIKARGQSFEKIELVPKGEPERFLIETELGAKFARLAEPVLGAERTAKLADLALEIAVLGDISILMREGGHGGPLRLAGE
ncbi:MAG: MmgE/PrpD family protein, partial [Acetobacteraceae bacterium]